VAMTAVPLTVGLILVRKAMKAVKRMMDVVPFPVTRDSDTHTHTNIHRHFKQSLGKEREREKERMYNNNNSS